jgi:hypothetical protein
MLRAFGIDAVAIPVDQLKLAIPRSDFYSLCLNVLLKIAFRELKPPCDPVMCKLILFGQSINVSSCGLKVLCSLIDVEKSFSRCNGHLSVSFSF